MMPTNFDPIARGYVASLARPGGNITGVVFRQIELAGKQVEILTQTFPDRKRLAILFDAQTVDQLGGAQQTAKSLDIETILLKLENPPYDFAAAFTRAKAAAQKAADIPVEQATKFDTAVNLKTATAIGVELPTAILLRADKVIE